MAGYAGSDVPDGGNAEESAEDRKAATNGSKKLAMWKRPHEVACEIALVCPECSAAAAAAQFTSEIEVFHS